MYPVRGCYQHICAIMSGRIKGARPLRMHRCYFRGIQQGKWRTHGRESMAVFSFHTGFSIHFRSQSRTYELLVPLRSVQQPIMPGAYLIGPIQLLCVPKVKLPRLPLLEELFFEAPETTDTKFLFILFARNKSSSRRWVRALSSVQLSSHARR